MLSLLVCALPGTNSTSYHKHTIVPAVSDSVQDVYSTNNSGGSSNSSEEPMELIQAHGWWRDQVSAWLLTIYDRLLLFPRLPHGHCFSAVRDLCCLHCGVDQAPVSERGMV